jgi:hypothetical protein
MKKIGWENDQPSWVVKKVRQLQNVFESSEFTQEVSQLRKDFGEKSTNPIFVIQLLETYRLPYGCYEAIEEYIRGMQYDPNNPKEWVTYIKPEPITYLDNRKRPKSVGDDNSLGKYFKLMELLEGEQVAVEKLIQDRIVLVLPEDTSRKELDKFLDKNWKKLGTNKRIRRPYPLVQEIIRLRDDGLSFPKIAEKISTTLEPTDLAKIYNREKKKLSRK